jgi:hypothetical protein
MTVRELVDDVWRIDGGSWIEARNRADALDAQVAADRAEIERLQAEVEGAQIKVRKAEALMNEALAANARLHDQLATARQEGVNEGLEMAARSINCACAQEIHCFDDKCPKLKVAHIRALKTAPTP